jgi:hypothetical protein
MGGVNSSTYTSDFQDAEFKNGLGYQFGADVLLGESWYFQPGLFFEFLSNPVENIDQNSDIENITVNRLRIPVYIGHRFFEPESLLNFRLFAGLNASLVVNKSVDESLNFEEGDFSNFVYGLNIGGGFDLAIFFVDVGYMFGLNDTFQNGGDSPHNNLFFANLGLRF